jgi:hypothetical protein
MRRCAYFRYIWRSTPVGTARVFRSGNSQAVRLPKQFRLNSEEAEIFRRGDESVLREKDGTMGSPPSTCWRTYSMILTLPLPSARRTGRRSARGRDGTPASAGHEHLHLHPPEKTRGGFAAIPQAPSRGSSAFCHLELGRLGSLFSFPLCRLRSLSPLRWFTITCFTHSSS